MAETTRPVGPKRPARRGDQQVGATGAPIQPRRQRLNVEDDPPTFTALGVMPSLATALEQRGFTTPFAVQQLAIPVALAGADLIGQARTGTGKTLAFGLPLLQRIIAPHEPDYDQLVAPGAPQALVVTPTRELAMQVADDLVAASVNRPVRVLTIYGGRAYEPQLEALASGTDVVVGTPGRLLDLARQGRLDLGHVKVVVLDEADEMLDLGFLADVETLLAMTPELRQTMLFSATMPADVITLARRYMRHPVNVRAESPAETATVPTTAQFVYRAHRMDKDEVLARILQAESRALVMMFARTKRQTQTLADELKRRGFSVAAVHGDLNQDARERALAAFRAGKVDVLVATDVAARGIDVDGVTHVINVSCPDDEKTYLHRIGRTGRAGASGVAITLVDWEDLSRWSAINSALGLPYPDPPETYSTSEHLFHDLGIPSDAGGRLPGAAVEQPPARKAERDERRPGRRRPSGRSAGQRQRPAPDAAVAATSPGGEPRGPGGESRGPGGESRGPGGEATEAGAPRRRRRRRTRGGGAGTARAPGSGDGGPGPQPAPDSPS